MAFSLKPNEEITVSALAATVVYGIFQLNAPNMADVRGAMPHNKNVHGSVKTAVWTSAVTVAALGLLSKSATVYVVGGLMTVAEGWKYFHANASSPVTGQVTAPSQFGLPTQPGSNGNGPA